MPKLSFIVPAFNIDEKVSRCIESILNQTHKDIELVIVNDGSTDSTLKVCLNYTKKDKRARVISHQKNRGLPASRNTGVKASTGDFIWHVDGDDYLCNRHAAEKIFSRLEADNTPVARFGLIRKKNDDELVQNQFTDDVLDGLNVLKRSGANNIVSYVYSKNLSDLLELNFLEGVDIGEDQIFVTKLLRCAASVSVMSESFYVYDIGGQSMMRKAWSFERYQQDRVYMRHAIELLRDKPVLLEVLKNTRKNYIINTLLERAKKDLEDIELDLYCESCKQDIEALGLNECSFPGALLDDNHFDKIFKDVEVIIHVGCHKTATTSVQQALCLAKEDLALNGVVYIDMKEFRQRITNRCHGMSDKEVRLELLNLVLPLAFRKINRVVISEENLIQPEPNFPLPCLKSGFRVNRLFKIYRSLKNVKKKIIITLRNYDEYIVSMHSELCRHREYISIENYVLYDKLLTRCSWLYLIDALKAFCKELEIWQFEYIKNDVVKFASYLVGFDISYARQVVDYETRRSVASAEVHKIIQSSSNKSPKFFRKLDVYYAEGTYFDPFSFNLRNSLKNLYTNDLKRLTEYNGITYKSEFPSFLNDVPKASRFSEAAQIRGIGPIKPAIGNFVSGHLCEGFWRKKLFSNIEERDYFNYTRSSATKKGISAMLRVKNEEKNIIDVLLSIQDMFEEIVLVDNGSIDTTLLLVEQLKKKNIDFNNKLKIYRYPIVISRCGIQNFNTPENSIHSLAYFYNWAFSKCSCEYVWKWDGDMVIDDSMKKCFLDFKYSILSKKGCVGVPRGITLYRINDDKILFKKNKYEKELRVFPNTDLVSFKKDILWERICLGFESDIVESSAPVFAEIKHINEDEFSHWSKNTLVWGPRKVREFRDYNYVKELVQAGLNESDLVKKGFSEYRFTRQR